MPCLLVSIILCETTLKILFSQVKLIKGCCIKDQLLLIKKNKTMKTWFYFWEDFPFDYISFFILSMSNMDSIFSIPFSKSRDRSYRILFILIL